MVELRTCRFAHRQNPTINLISPKRQIRIKITSESRSVYQTWTSDPPIPNHQTVFDPTLIVIYIIYTPTNKRNYWINLKDIIPEKRAVRKVLLCISRIRNEIFIFFQCWKHVNDCQSDLIYIKKNWNSVFHNMQKSHHKCKSGNVLHSTNKTHKWSKTCKKSVDCRRYNDSRKKLHCTSKGKVSVLFK